MKKVILLCSFGLLGTFAMASNEVITTNTHNVVELSYDAEIEIQEQQLLGIGCCTATVWYNGTPVQTYTVCGTSNNCGLARAFAEAYVEYMGG